MRKVALFYCLLMLPGFPLSAADAPSGQPPVFRIELHQDGLQVPIDGHRATLAKAPFEFYVIFDTEQTSRYDVHVHFSERASFVEGLAAGQSLEELLYFAHPDTGGAAAAEAYRWGAMTVAYDPFNELQEIYLSDYAHHQFFYDSPELSSFDEVLQEETLFIGKRTIAFFSDDNGHTHLPLSELPYDSLYVALLFVEFPEPNQPSERQWEYFQLVFE